jgi:hypothetical protein
VRLTDEDDIAVFLYQIQIGGMEGQINIPEARERLAELLSRCVV